MNYSNLALINKADPDNIYINVRINHDNTNTVTTRAFYDVTKTIPILDKPDEYYLAVVDFTIPLTSIPLTIAKVKFPSNEPNDMQALVEIKTEEGTYPQYLVYVPSNENFPAPQQNDPTRQIETPYYYIYSYTHLLEMFNNALQLAFDAASGDDNPLGTEAPYFSLNASTQLITLFISDSFKLSGAKLCINDAALNYLQGFNYNYVRANPPNLNNDRYVFNFYEEGNWDQVSSRSSPTVYYSGWFYEQEYQALELWTDLRKIYITTSTIPVKAEEKSVNLANGTQTGQTAYVPVLFDYTPPLTNSSSSRTISYYVPSAQLRLVDILGTEPLNKVSLEVYWQDTLGDAFPLYLQLYQAINIKLGFFKKSLYKNYYPEEYAKTHRIKH